MTEKPDERSQFFGFQTSRKSFFTNLVIVAAACSFIYLGGFRTGIIRAIYNNTALTTAALVLCFLLADLIGPWLLVRIICLLSKLRVAATFLTRKVHV